MGSGRGRPRRCCLLSFQVAFAAPNYSVVSLRCFLSPCLARMLPSTLPKSGSEDMRLVSGVEKCPRLCSRGKEARDADLKTRAFHRAGFRLRLCFEGARNQRLKTSRRSRLWLVVVFVSHVVCLRKPYITPSCSHRRRMEQFGFPNLLL